MGLAMTDAHAEIVDMEQELSKLRAENARLLRNDKNRRLEMGDLEEAARNVLDEIAYEDDTTDTRELRKRLWNDADTEAKIDAEGYDAS